MINFSHKITDDITKSYITFDPYSGVDDDLDFGYSQALNRTEAEICEASAAGLEARSVIVADATVSAVQTISSANCAQIIEANTATVISAVSAGGGGQQMATVVSATSPLDGDQDITGSQGTIYQMVQTDQGLVATPVSVNVCIF